MALNPPTDPITGGGRKRIAKGAMNVSLTNTTTCKLCLHRVLVGEPRVWLRKPMGVSHERCAANRTDIEHVTS